MMRLDRHFCAVLLTALLGCSSFESAKGPNDAATDPEIKTGFAAMEHPELLPMFPPNGTQTKQFNCYDTTGGNTDGAWQYWPRYVDEHGEFVIFDEVGPGCLYRQQMNVWVRAPQFGVTPMDPKTRIKYYFDDEATPRLDMPIYQLFGYGQKFTPPFTPPLVFFDTNSFDHLWSDRFANSFYPFPFARRLKITINAPHKDAGKWYQYTYLKYPPDTKVQTWAGTQLDSPVVRRQWENLGVDPKDGQGNVVITRDLPIAAAAPR